MSRITLARRLQAVTIAYHEAKAQLHQQIRARTICDVERDLRQAHVLALRAARESLVTMVREQAPSLARLQHDAMVAADAIPTQDLEALQ
ncbi:hypothetical protein CCR97_04310 [Rhodoplanes elegans]|uniref:Uncharacterized protein n=1 Tax=Rhodoplanes elegans TaxID=29408 RepID=A0A327JYB4_9BRAD|nr:hypothetical protein [Rhodoplanes elegans]MBK5957433.1 hypothetical protein [Rhodoplanes elegans]RAI31021.1 hypothetical protein CH338_26585 [Rhodoplanes elegans]